MARHLAELIDQEIAKMLGPGATFEQRQDAAAALTSDALWFRTDKDVDGSFITSKAVPGDVDLVVVHDIDDFEELDAHPQAEYLYQDRALELYKFDLFVECDEDTMVRFFQKVSTEYALEHGLAPNHPKGLIRVKT